VKNRNSILNELNDLGSDLVNINPQNVYEVPKGYFEELTHQIFTRIKAMEVSDPKEELDILSPAISSISKKIPYQVPAGYFENLGERMMKDVLEHTDFMTSREEIASISPLLSSISKNIPYQVPAGYFENLNAGTEKKIETKIISIQRNKWYRWVAAAAIFGIIAISALFIYNQNKIDPVKHPDEWVAKNVEKKVSSQQLDEFVKLATGDDNLRYGNDPVRSEEIKELMKDVSEKEIQEFLNETVSLRLTNDSDVLMN
jgi:hypothetical protein